MNANAVQLVLEAIGNVEAAIRAGAIAACRNAVLQYAEPELVLPSPAVGLMRFEVSEGYRPEPNMVLRSVDPLTSEGEALLTLVHSEVPLQPWRVRSSEWIPGKMVAQDGGSRASGVMAGISTLLVRPDDSPGSSGWLSLLVGAGRWTESVMDNVHVTAADLTLSSKKMSSTPYESQKFFETCPVHGCLESLCASLLMVKIPSALAHEQEIELRILFEDVIPFNNEKPTPDVVANVFPVWNSLEQRYPEFADISKSVVGGQKRATHVLTFDGMGSSWDAWRVARVGSSREQSVQFSRQDARGVQHLSADSGSGYRLAYIPRNQHRNMESRVSGGSQGSLGIILSPQAIHRLKRDGHEVGIDFMVTTGSKGNHLPSGAEFQAVDLMGPSQRSRLRGSLVGPTWGGSDSVLPHGSAEEGPGPVLPFVANQGRTVADVVAFIRHRFGDLLHLVDPRDLLRWGEEQSTCILLVRVMFQRVDLKREEKCAVLAALQDLLLRYLGLRSTSTAIRIIEVPEDKGAVT